VSIFTLPLYLSHFKTEKKTTMTLVKVKPGESVEKALRALKKRLDKEGVMKSVKAHRFYLKPSVKKRAKSKAALKYKKR